MPLNLDKEINLMGSSYTVNNANGRDFANLFFRFDQLNKSFKSRFLDRFLSRMKVEHLFDMKKELLVEMFKYLDFESLRAILNSCSYLREEFWKQNEWFWFNLYSINFGKPPFKSSTGNWAKIYRKKQIKS
uniref:F-box domain-containing protein n=1 Tax=Euplotes crassus TaxID=5936 RepID=A0A7S3NPN5_EUPCR|mmetsp:Transcript_19249/g.18933  ORF Transcript_19249/g.18933 Transcript_19249/m.18933 type:complete len:131 (+) Transcript_19249:309-701(+)